LPAEVDFAVFLVLLDGEAAGDAAAPEVCPATGDTTINAASTPERQRATSGLEFGKFTTLIYSL
jgi:hypothetical protein